MPVTYYASDDERSRLIDGLHAVAQFLHDHPDIPAPRWADVLVFPPDSSTDEEKRAEVDVIASRIGAETSESTGGHYFCSVSFGPVEYRAVAIPGNPESRKARRRVTR
jgi:hypothetical protein